MTRLRFRWVSAALAGGDWVDWVPRNVIDVIGISPQSPGFGTVAFSAGAKREANEAPRLTRNRQRCERKTLSPNCNKSSGCRPQHGQTGTGNWKSETGNRKPETCKIGDQTRQYGVAKSCWHEMHEGGPGGHVNVKYIR